MNLYRYFIDLLTQNYLELEQKNIKWIFLSL